MQHDNSFLSLVEECRPFVKEVGIDFVKEKLEKKEEDFTLIDVREDYEWNQGHIPTAIHLSRGVIERDIEKAIPNKNTNIVLYCGGGFRSVLSAFNLQKMGYTNVISMDGGMRDWLNSGNKVVL
ncbi:MAG: rhodanese-like domain-containing protein [Neisseriaceae bacterium]